MKKGYVQIKGIRLLGVPVRVHWSVPLMATGLLALSLESPFSALVAIASYLGVIVLHEAGHAWMAGQRGCQPLLIELSVIHGRCYYRQSGDPLDDALIAWGGFTAQMIVAVPLLLLSAFLPLLELPLAAPVVVFLGYLNVLIGLVNLAPTKWLDGGRAWTLVPLVLARRKQWVQRR